MTNKKINLLKLYALQNVEEGRCILQRAQSQYKEYDFESRLNVRIHAALKKAS